jgi:hypothetical protein
MTPKDHEIRTYDAKVEIRTDDQGKRKIRGHAAVFNQIGGDERYFLEQIAPGAFKETIANDDIRAVWNHNDDYVLGRKQAGTLTLSEDEDGLYVEIDPPDTQWARDHMVSIDRGDVSQMSFKFEILDSKDQSWETKEGVDLRTLKRVKLWEVSPVTFPFYEGTDVALRSRDAAKQSAKTPRTPLSKRLNPNLKGAPK